MVPPPPAIGDYTWNILEPEILKPDYSALLMHTTVGRTGPMTITSDEDYGELKRHRWEFQHATSFAYGILTADGAEEVACVYVNPSKKQGYDATVHFLMTERGAKENLQPLLEAQGSRMDQNQLALRQSGIPRSRCQHVRVERAARRRQIVSFLSRSPRQRTVPLLKS